jgi:NADPH2:quinone reductase
MHWLPKSGPPMSPVRLKSHIHEIFALERAADAHRLMESSQHIGKILLRI